MFEVELVGNLLLVLFNPSTTGESADTCRMIWKMQTFKQNNGKLSEKLGKN